MRIAAVTNSRIPSLTANSIQVMKVCEAMTAMGHETCILAPQETPAADAARLQAHYGLQALPVVEWHASRRFLRRLDFVLSAQRAAERFGANLLYTWLPQAAVFALYRRRPVVLEMHADVGGRAGAWWLRAFWRLPGKKRISITTRALRSVLEASARHGFPDGQTVIAPNAVDFVRYADLPDPAGARGRLNFPTRQTIGFTGHVYPGRGAELLVELARRMPHCSFLWVGGTPELVAHWREKLDELRVTNVTMTGFVDNQTLPLYQAAADILLMPYSSSVTASSGQEISSVINPMKMHEYMAAGRAIVCADLPVIHEVLDETCAVFCRPDATDEWETVLRTLLDDRGRREALGAHARLRAQAWTWTARALRILGDLDWAT